MDIKAVGQKISTIILRYKYVIAVVLVGVVLMTIPFGTPKSEEREVTQPTKAANDVRKDLAEILASVQGAGRVEVMLSVDTNGKTVYQTDSDISNGNDSITERHDTVIITDSDRNQQGLVQQTLAPSYRGAIVVCQGADDPQVKLAIMEAVKNATGLGFDKISVLKMK